MKIQASTSRVRTSFDPELELPRLHQWFAENPHPSRLTLQMYVKELNSLASRQSRKLLEVHNLCYWFKNARAAYKRAELRIKKTTTTSTCGSGGGPKIEQQNQQSFQGSFQNNQLTATDTMQSNSGDSSSPTSGSNFGRPVNGSTGALRHTSNNSFMSIFNKALISSKSSPQLTKATHQSSSSELNAKTSERHPSLRKLSSFSSVAANLESRWASGQGKGRMSSPQFVGGQSVAATANSLLLDINAGATSDNGLESPTRDDSTSPSSTVSLPVSMGNQNVPGGANNNHNINATSNLCNGLSQQQAASLNGLDLATAVNCLLNTASNITAAAASAAAAAAASSGLTSAAAATLPANNLLGQVQVPPSSAAISLAASLLNSNLMNAASGQQVMGAADPAAIAAAAAAAISGAAARQQFVDSLVDQPMRQLLTSFNPTASYQIAALGMLDNKILDANILNSMTFPTSACAPHAAFAPYNSTGGHLHGSANKGRQHNHLLHHQQQQQPQGSPGRPHNSIILGYENTTGSHNQTNRFNSRTNGL